MCVLLKQEASDCLNELELCLKEWTDLVPTFECEDHIIDRYVQLDLECAGCEAGIDVITAASKVFSDSSTEMTNFLNRLNTKALLIAKNGEKIVSYFTILNLTFLSCGS